MNALDHTGNAIAGLGPSDIRAELDGQPIRVVSLTATSAPRRVVILLDLSGSTDQFAEIARWAARDLATSGQVQLRIALVMFSDRTIESFDFSRRPQEIAEALSQLPQRKGGAKVFDALQQVVIMFGPPLFGDAVYLISGGAENRSKARPEAVEKEYLERGIRIYVFDPLSSKRPFLPTVEESEGASLLSNLSKLTGGSALDLPGDFPLQASRERLATDLHRLYQQMANPYELRLALPTGTIRKPQHWDLDVVDNQGRKRKDVQVVYPRELVPCAGYGERTR
jgi:VWA domain containing CoxE-like protein